ncbi:hypothetical protein ACFL2K_03985, partial [Candidatus Margulisiibacteriota bacterium]
NNIKGTKKDTVLKMSNVIFKVINSLGPKLAQEVYDAMPGLTPKQIEKAIYPQYKSIFKSYDIRGTVLAHELKGKAQPQQLNKDIAERVGYALGALSFDLPEGKFQLKPGDQFVIGHDNGISSPQLAQGLAEGLSKAGINVILINIASTGEVYESVPRFDAQGGIMITRSHTEQWYNGIKMLMGNECLSSDNCNDGKSDNISKIGQAIWNGLPTKAVQKGAIINKAKVERLSKALFKQHLIDEYKDVLAKGKSKVAINYNGGVATSYIDAYGAILPEKRMVEEFRQTSDPDAVEGLPDPSKAKYLKKIFAWAKKNPGVAVYSYDLDADRVSSVEGTKDGQYNLYLGDKLAYPIADYYLRMYLPMFAKKYKELIKQNLIKKGKPVPKDLEKFIFNKLNAILVDPRCSLNLKRLIEKLGGKFQPQRIGHSHVKASMNRIMREAVKAFGFESVEDFVAKTNYKMTQLEYSLHVFLTNNKGIPSDCAIRANFEIIKMLDKLSEYYGYPKGMTLTNHIEELKKQNVFVRTCETPEARPWYTSLSPDKHEFVYKIFDYLKNKFKGNKDYVFTDIKDGFTINTPIGAVMFRHSNTSPKLTFKVETISGNGKSAKDNYCELLKIIMGPYNSFGGEKIAKEYNPSIRTPWIKERIGNVEDIKISD